MQVEKVHRVVETGTDGSMLIEISYEEVALTINGDTLHPALPVTQLRVQSDDTIIGDAPCGCGQASYSVPLPQAPAAVGTTWTRPLQIDNDGVVITGTSTYTVTAIEQTADGRVARIRSTTAGTVDKADLGPFLRR